MRHKYETRGIVLARAPVGEANTLLTLLTPELGLVRVRAQGLRRSGAKLAAALVTFAESDIVLVKGKEFWRLAGAVLVENRGREMTRAARERAARVVGLLLRLVVGESHDPKLYALVTEFMQALATLPEERYDAVEVLAALSILRILGLDAGDLPEGAERFSPELLAEVTHDRATLIARINQGIVESGL